MIRRLVKKLLYKGEYVKIELNRNQLKYIAIIAMVLDHFAVLFIPTSNYIYSVFRIIGKLTAPIMCYFLAEGYRYTSSKKKYGMRLFNFSIISQFAFSLAFYNKIFTINFNMIFTLFLCFLVLLSYEKIANKLLKWISILSIVVISHFSDWGILAPLWVLVFYIFKEEKMLQTIYFSIITILVVHLKYMIIYNYSLNTIFIYYGLFLSIPILYLYNGEKGNSNKFNKWFFYIFYWRIVYRYVRRTRRL